MTTAHSTQYLTKQQFSNAKRRLTIALRSGDARKVIAEVDATFADWNDGDYAYPDDWARWQRARDDAEMALAHGWPMR
jgi:hypothetical protein